MRLSELDEANEQFVSEYCEREVEPLLTPVTVDPAHPFPRVLNKALCQALLLRRRRRSAHAVSGRDHRAPGFAAFVKLPEQAGSIDYVFLADLVARHVADMYRGYEIISEAAFRVTRNSNLYLQEEESRSLLDSVRAELHNRRKGDAVRLEIEADASPEIIDRLQSNFELEGWQVFHTAGPVNLSRLMYLYSHTDRPDLKFKPFVGRQMSLGPRCAQHLRRASPARHPAASSLRFLRSGRVVYQSRRG